MAVFLRRLPSIKSSGITKSVMYPYTTFSRVNYAEMLKCSFITNSLISISQSERSKTLKCCSMHFSLNSYWVPSNILSDYSEMIFQLNNSSDQIFFRAQQQQYSLFFISILAVLGVKAFNSMPVLADEIHSEESNSAELDLDADEFNQDVAFNESEDNIALDSWENDGTFSQVFAEDLSISDPIEISDVQSLRHSHIVREAAGVSAEAALVLVIRASRALLAAMEDYRASLVHLLDLLGYNLVLIKKLGQGAVYEEVLKQVTGAMVDAKSRTDNCKKRVTDLQLLVRVSAQAVENLNLSCHLSGAETTALASSAAVTSLRVQVEAAEAEVRQLQRDVLAGQAEIITLEKTRQHEKKVIENEPAMEECLGVVEQEEN